MSFRYKKNKVFFSEQAIYEAPGIIDKIFPYKKNLILHYSVNADKKIQIPVEEAYQNILSLNFNGNVLWRLPLPEKSHLPRFQPDYATLRIDEDGHFWAGDTCAYENKFDPNTGKILERVFTK